MWERMQGFSWTIGRKEKFFNFWNSEDEKVRRQWCVNNIQWHAEHTSLLEGEDSKLSSCSRCLLDDSAPGGDGEPEPGDCREKTQCGKRKPNTICKEKSLSWDQAPVWMYHMLTNEYQMNVFIQWQGILSHKTSLCKLLKVISSSYWSQTEWL